MYMNIWESLIGKSESQQRNLESVFATAAVLTLFGIGLTVALLIWKRGNFVDTCISIISFKRNPWSHLVFMSMVKSRTLNSLVI